jgi:glucose-6-phosphate isomerase
MSGTPEEKWARFQTQYTWFKSVGLGLDFSRSAMPEDYEKRIQPLVERALREMRSLEGGSIANPDEGRMVGHYWLRNPELAPTQEIRAAIQSAVEDVQRFAASIHSGATKGATGAFTTILLIGIGGSALGPQFVANALSRPAHDKMRIRFMDNTDPDGFDRVLEELQGDLGRTLCLVISKSGGTKETRNAMVEVEAAYVDAGLDFGRHAVAVTSVGSELSKYAAQGRWLAEFPMWDWVGGRTSELSPVGLLPAALQGFDVLSLLRGAKEMDNATRESEMQKNPALQLAVFIHYIANGSGSKAMVVLPYKDRLELFSRYLQQLVMESLGKAEDREGAVVNQGLTVYGNKGSTDQHAYIQQLRDGLLNFFCLFISVLHDRGGKDLPVEPNITSGDYLNGFMLGTRDALAESGRESVLLTVDRIDAYHVGSLIALFERTVGLYASLINVNAYHQPGVEAGKKAATAIINLQGELLEFLRRTPGKFHSVAEISSAVRGQQLDLIFRVCEHLAANGRVSVRNPALPDRSEFASL